MSDADVQAPGAVLLGGAHHQIVWFIHQTSDEIGQTCCGIGGVPTAFEDDDLEFRIEPVRPRRRRHPRCVAADDDQSRHREAAVIFSPARRAAIIAVSHTGANGGA